MRARILKSLRIAAVVVAVATVVVLVTPARGWVIAKLRGRRTVGEAVREYGDAARGRLEPSFASAGVDYPPPAVTLVALKDEKILELWAGAPGALKLVKRYPILAASGHAGPKLKEGDRQVPEGIYRVESLNPNSAYHLALRVDYPNAFDRQQAEQDGRADLGGNIMIHGSDSSVGCLAMGDPAIEELFTLAADVGAEKVTIVIAPVDPRKHALKPSADDPSWVATLYENIAAAFDGLRGGGTQ